MLSHRTLFALALGLTGCNTAAPLRTASVHDVVPADMVSLSSAVEHWDAATRAEVRDASRVVLTNCPYHRSGFQVPFVLHDVIATISVDDLPVEVRADWSATKSHLGAYVALLERIAGPELPRPGQTDYLATLLPGSTPSRAELRTDPDPMARTALLQSQIDGQSTLMPPAVYDRVAGAVDVLYEQTGDSWPPSHLLEPTRQTLKRAAAVSAEPARQHQLEALLRLIETHEQQGC